MGGKPWTREPKLRDLHETLLAHHRDTGTLGRLLDVPTWNRIVVNVLGAMSRQSVQDITFTMECLGLIQRKKGQGIIVLDAPGFPTSD